MRKHLLLIIALCLHLAARGQTVPDAIDLSWLPQPTQAKALRYWIDDDIGSMQTSNILNGRYTVDASSLIEGLHTIHFQIIDSDEKVAAPYSGIFLKMVSHLSASEASTLRYWFDDDTSVSTCNANVGTQLLDASALLDGLHTLHYQVVDTEGNASYVASGIFLKMQSGLSSSEASTLRYWFDDDTSVSTCNVHIGTQLLDASALLDGLHTLHYQVVDTEGNVSYVASEIFLKMQSGLSSSEASTLRYWFDDDTSVSTCNANVGTQLLDASALLDGLHTLHYQVVDTEGNTSYVASGIFLKMGKMAETGVVTAKKLIYWFDDEQTTTTVDMLSGIMSLDASNLLDGLHTVHYMVVCSDGSITSAHSSIFLRMDIDIQSTTAHNFRYWFDDETDVTVTEIAQGTQMLDASHLLDGLHTVHYQIVDENGDVASPYSSIFLKMEKIGAATTTAQSLRYWFDSEATITTIEIAQGTQMLDASYLLDGLHTVHYQIVDNSGAVTSPYSSVFLKMAERDETLITAQGLRYWFDDDKEVKTTSVAGGTQIIDVTNLLAGLHTLHYQLVDSNGDVSTPMSRIFIKNFDKAITDGDNRITKYQYWLNMNSEAMQTVELDAAANPYTLIALLPMQKEPLQSSQFHFEVTNNVPTIYAKNTLHVRFYDAQNYFSDGQKQFVDYSVKQEVTDLEWLESGVRATTAKPAENAVKWYCLTAEPGDSVQFRLDRAATIQLFDPSGGEVFSASGSESVGWSGCHTRESGTYYLALHDVTATYGNTVSIDYNHIDKYAVLRQDVSVVGNGGCSTITFEGNGLYHLRSVTLTNGNSYSINHTNIEYLSDNEVAIMFDFEDKMIGMYNAIFDFNNEYRIVNNAVNVEEADSIYLDLKIENASTFLRGNSITYTLKIHNRGNSTAYRLPIEIQLFTQDQEAITYAKFSHNIPQLDVEWMDSTIIEKDSITALKAYIAQQGDLLHFASAYDSISHRFIKDCLLAIDISPKSTYVITLSLKSDETVELRASIPSKWAFYSNTNENKASDHIERRAGVKENMCCVREKVECLMNVLVGALDFISIVGGPQLKIADCVAGLGNTTLQFAYDVWCGETQGGKNPRKAAQDLVWDAINEFVGCICSITGIDKMNIQWIYQHIYNNISITWDCIAALTQEMPNCPPDPESGGGSSTPVNSYDPNSIYGYTAESTSKAVMGDLTDVYYRIEFENDTTFATAAAHDIYVTDTLDATKFDLTTFAPTRIIIGDKSAELTGEKNFVTTIDMRPEINAIAQVEGSFDEQKGIAKWHISSLDPMTMEPTAYVMDGVLPVSTNGQGIGEVSYDIKLKDGLAHGTEVNNRASIVFDANEPIMTPTWTNFIDRIAPESHVTDVKMLNDSTAAVSIEATDELSGPWHYDVYVQYGTGSAWVKMAENVPIDKTASVKVYEGINHGFYVVVTDSAGNVEQKEAAREYTFEVFAPQVDTNTKLQLAQGWNWVSHNQQEALGAEVLKPKAQRIVSQTDELYKDSRFGWTGTLDELLPTQMYKVQMAEADEVQLSGRLFNAAFRAVPLYAGWNWIGYPVAQTMTPAEALQKMEAEEDDAIIGRDGLATYSDGEWTGTLTEMVPGQGYMYRSASDKSLFLNATAQASSRAVHRSRSMADGQWPENWTVDRQRYPNVMGMVAELWQDGKPVEDSGEWLLGAFSGGECRGLAEAVGNYLMMNVYGRGGEKIEFFVMHRESGEILPVSESEEFRADLLGTVRQPYRLNMGVLTGIRDATRLNNNGQIINNNWYDLQGRRISVSSASSENSVLPKGVYIVTDGQKKGTQKVVRK